MVSFFFFNRQQDQGVFAQQVYYTSLKPTNAATLPGGSPDTYSACCSLVSHLAKALRLILQITECTTSFGVQDVTTTIHLPLQRMGVPVSEVILNGYSRCFSRRLQRHSIRVTLIAIYIIQN